METVRRKARRPKAHAKRATITIRLEADHRDSLVAAAQAAGVSVSEYVRKVARSGLTLQA